VGGEELYGAPASIGGYVDISSGVKEIRESK
jgi:hypothetical protein